MEGLHVIRAERAHPTPWANANGDVAIVFYDTTTGTWAYYIQFYWGGVLAYESDEIVGFASADEAEAAARANYEEVQ